MKESKRNRIIAMLDKHPHLILIERDVLSIADRIQEYDKNMFVLFNLAKKKYEIHSFEYAAVIPNPISTFQMTVPFESLDARTLHHLYDNDIKIHGRKIFDRIEEQEERFEKQKKRDFTNWVQDVAGETKSMFAKDAWSM